MAKYTIRHGNYEYKSDHIEFKTKQDLLIKMLDDLQENKYHFVETTNGSIAIFGPEMLKNSTIIITE
jgi:hypothetical protein